jgi:hypothetical protein
MIPNQLARGRPSSRMSSSSLENDAGLTNCGVYSRSIVINHLQRHFKNPNIAVTCIYCNYKEQAVHTVSNLVSSLLKQLIQDRSALSDAMKSFCKYHQDRDVHPTLDDFLEALGSEIEMYSKVFIVVDALDECTEDYGTRANLLRALRTLPGTVNLMFTSRDLSSIARQFRGTKRLDIQAHGEDLRKYVRGRIASLPRQHLIGLQEAIEDRVVKVSGGM